MSKTLKEIEKDYTPAEALVRRQRIRRERNRLLKKGYIRTHAIPTPLVKDAAGNWTVGFETTYVRSNH